MKTENFIRVIGLTAFTTSLVYLIQYIISH